MCPVFTLPMRNWNIKLNPSPIMSTSRFYPTYEELKLVISISFLTDSPVFTLPMRNWNSRFGRRKLAPPNVFTLPMRNWNLKSLAELKLQMHSFYPTYEELKSQSHLRDLQNSLVFTLPMRNWNSHVTRTRRKWPEFLPYLWGIEIQWRRPWESCGEYSFYPTYEELKCLCWPSRTT